MKGEPFRAWQPLTFGGVARYGHDWLGRLFVTALIISLIGAGAIVITARRAWSPVIEAAIAKLPPGVEIRGGRLTAAQPLWLAENPFLAIGLGPVGGELARSTSDLDVTLGPAYIRVRSILGMLPISYAPQWTFVLDQNELAPWWGAWRPAALAYLFVGSILFLFSNWIALGLLYALGPWLLALLFRRQLTLWGAWKLSVAALMPGAILISVGIFLYGFSQIRLPELMGIWLAHFPVGWIYSAGAVFWLPKIEAEKTNPFDEEPPEADEEDAEPPQKKNPFE